MNKLKYNFVETPHFKFIITKLTDLSLHFQQPWQLRSDNVFAAHFTALLSVNYKFQPKPAAFILESDHSFLKAWIVQTLYSNIVVNSRPILQKSTSMSTLST